MKRLILESWPVSSHRAIKYFMAFLLASFFMIPTAFTQSGELAGYRATKIEGEVFSRSPLATGWRPVRAGQMIGLNHLLQVTEASSVTLQQIQAKSSTEQSADQGADQKDRSNQSGNSKQVKLATPMVVRLSSKMFKEIEFSKNFIEKEFQKATQEEAAAAQSFFADAWSRTVDFLATQPDAPSKEELAKITGDLSVASGLQGSFFPIEQKTSEVKVSWSDKNSARSGGYKIFVWKKGEKKGEAVGSSSSGSYNINLTDPGEYNVQIETADGKVATKPVQFYVDYEDLPPSSGEAVVSRTEESVKLIDPKPSQVFIDSAPKTWIRFSWRLFSESQEPLMLSVTLNGRLVQQENVSGLLSKSLELSPGSYKWFLSRPSARLTSTGPEAVSEILTFEVRAAKRQDVMSVVKNHLNVDQNTSITISEW